MGGFRDHLYHPVQTLLGAVSMPDVSHHVGPPWPGGRTQCFDFKLCGLGPSGKPWQDTYRGGKTGVQYLSQTAIGGGSLRSRLAARNARSAARGAIARSERRSVRSIDERDQPRLGQADI